MNHGSQIRAIFFFRSATCKKNLNQRIVVIHNFEKNQINKQIVGWIRQKMMMKDIPMKSRNRTEYLWCLSDPMLGISNHPILAHIFHVSCGLQNVPRPRNPNLDTLFLLGLRTVFSEEAMKHWQASWAEMERSCMNYTRKHRFVCKTQLARHKI